MFLFLLLVTALTSIVIYLRTNNDIFGLLGIFISLICLIWGLAIAHWSVHVLALFALLFLSKPVTVATVESRQR
jgi:multisubunit Na+/H+ antiporter MnhG subunit